LRRWRSLCVAPYDDMDMARDWHDAQVDHITPFSMHDLRGRRGARQQAARPARAQRERPRPRAAGPPRARPLPAFHCSPQHLTDNVRLSVEQPGAERAARAPLQPSAPHCQQRAVSARRARRCSSTRWSWRGRAWRPIPAAGARRARTRACCTACRRPRVWRACPVRPRAARPRACAHVRADARHAPCLGWACEQLRLRHMLGCRGPSRPHNVLINR